MPAEAAKRMRRECMRGARAERSRHCWAGVGDGQPGARGAVAPSGPCGPEGGGGTQAAPALSPSPSRRGGEGRGEVGAFRPVSHGGRMNEGPAAGRGPGPLRRLYDWTLALAGRRHAVWALAAVAFAGKLVLPRPAGPAADPHGAGTAGGGVAAGRRLHALLRRGRPLRLRHRLLPVRCLWRPAPRALGQRGQARDLRALPGRVGAWIVIAGGFTPIPYKLITVASGAGQLDIGRLHPRLAARAGRALLHRGGAALAVRPAGPRLHRAPPGLGRSRRPRRADRRDSGDPLRRLEPALGDERGRHSPPGAGTARAWA